MDERIVQIAGGEFPAGLVGRAAEVVRSGGVLIHPTATVHGYGCRYDLAGPVERIRKLKGRDGEKPMIVLVGSVQWLDRICENVPDEARKLAAAFWPGPLTLVLAASEPFRASCAWTAGTVALRHCAHPFTAALTNELDSPLVSTSLGYSGSELPADSLAFIQDLYAGSDPAPPELAVIDTELDKPGRAASTIVDMSTPGSFRILRGGPVGQGELERAGGFRFSKD